MSYQEILIPFGLPPTEHANDLVKMLATECETDGLAMLLSRYHSLTRTQFDEFAQALPHEVWLNDKFKAEQSSLLQHVAHSLNVELSAGYWFLLAPVHLHIALNHLVLTDYQQLNLSEQDARILFEKAQALCNEVGLELVFGNACTWFLRSDEWNDFVTSSPDAACGHNIEIWSAKGSKELAWRKLQNEIQMEWFAHPIQEQREARGEKVVNGLWLWAGTSLSAEFETSTDHCRVGTILCPPLINHGGQKSLPTLRSSFLSNDWGTWAATMIELDQQYFKPLVAALKRREITQLQLHLSNTKTLLSIQTSTNALKKFWRKPTFNNLIT